MSQKKSQDTIKSLATGLSILDIISDSNQPLKFNDIQNITSITKSNLYKYLNTLVQTKFLYKDSSTQEYFLGSKFIEYGGSAVNRNDIIKIITPFLEEITQKTNNTSLFLVPTQKGPMISKINNSDSVINIGAQFGTTVPDNSSAGKLYKVFEKNTEFSKEELEIKNNLIAFANEPLIPEVSSVSIPILNQQHKLLGIITVVGFKSNISMSYDSDLCRHLLIKQKDISSLLN